MTARDDVNSRGSMKKRAWWVAIAALAAIVVYVGLERSPTGGSSRLTVPDEQSAGAAERSGLGTPHEGTGADLPQEDRSPNRSANDMPPPGFADTSPSISLGVAEVPTTRVSSEPAVRGTPDQAPALAHWVLHGSNKAAYRLQPDTSIAWSGAQSARVNSLAGQAAESDFGGVLQSALAEPYRGKRVSFTAKVRTVGAQGATIALGAHDSNGVQVSPKFMLVTPTRQAPVIGTSEWTTLRLVTEIPPNAVTLDYGSFLLGSGTMWVDSAELTIVDPSEPITQPPPQGHPRFVRDARTAPKVLSRPTDLDFEMNVSDVGVDRRSMNR